MDDQVLSHQASTPSRELAARSSWDGPVLGDGLLTAELAAFCQSGVSVVLASCDRSRWPVVGRGVGCLIDASGQVRILSRRTPNGALLQALADGAGLAVTFTLPTTHRSIQLKASGGRIATPAASDYPVVAAQMAALCADIIACGYAESLAAGYCAFEPHDLAAIDLLPDCAFVQTPGPGAGSKLES